MFDHLRVFECGSCGMYWEVPYGRPKPSRCPQCGSQDVLHCLYGGDPDSGMLDPHLFS